jgi:hypothetical protein
MAFLDFLVNDRPMRNLLKLPAGIPRRYAEYRPATSDGSTLPITNVGGYDELPFPRETPSIAAHREGLAAIDNLLDDDIGKRALAGLVRQIGMFYGDVLTHTIPEEFLTVARRHGLNLEKGSEAPRNLDGLERLLELPASDEICRQLLNAWNLYIDIARSVGATLDDRSKDVDKCYDKLFYGNNLESVTPAGEHYSPEFHDKERHLITEILNGGRAILSARL